MSNNLKEFKGSPESGEAVNPGMTRWCVGATLLTFCLIAGSCVKESRLSSRESYEAAIDGTSQEVMGWLDRVEGRPRVGAKVNVVGWAAVERQENRIEEVEILLDGIEIGDAVEGVERSDVAESYGKPNWNRSGWEAEVTLDKVLPGEHRIDAVALDSSGAKFPLRGGRLITVLDSR